MPDEKPPVDRAFELLVYAPVGAALYVRDMLPSMVGIFVSRGRREVESHRGCSRHRPRRTMPTSPHRASSEDGLGMARGVAGGGVGVARDVAGTALSGAARVSGVSEPVSTAGESTDP